MLTEHSLDTHTLLAAAALTKNRFIGYDGNLCAANARALGVSTTDFDSGEEASVAFCGIKIVEAGGAITVGAPVASDSTGRAVAAAALSATVPGTGTAVTSSSAQPAMTIAGGYLPQGLNGIALDAASQAGDFIRIKLVSC